MSWKSRHGWFHGKQHLCNVIQRRHGNQHLLSVTEKVSSNESVMEIAGCAASWKGVMESDTGGASRKSRHGMRHGKHDPSSVREKASWKALWRCDVMIVNSLVWCEEK